MFGADLLIGSNLENAEKAGLKLTETLKVTSLAQLRSMPAEVLMKAGGRSGIVIDGYVIPPAYITFASSAQNDVPLITGWNADEFYFGTPIKADAFKSDAEKKYGDLADEFLKVFPAGSDDEAAKSQKLLSVLSFGWQNYCWASLQSKTGKHKAYLYYFNHVPPGLPNYGAFHSAEFGYALKTLKYWNRPFEPWDHQLSEMMSSYWVNFAATGNPNGEGLPEWPAFETATIRVMQFGEKVETISLPFQSQLNFLGRYQAISQSGK
jgi:para-nitrobenzyl esterase